MPQEISKDVLYIPHRKYPVIFLTSLPIFLTFYFNEGGLQGSLICTCLCNIFSILLFGDWLSLLTPVHSHTRSLETSHADGLHGQGRCDTQEWAFGGQDSKSSIDSHGWQSHRQAWGGVGAGGHQTLEVPYYHARHGECPESPTVTIHEGHSAQAALGKVA